MVNVEEIQKIHGAIKTATDIQTWKNILDTPMLEAYKKDVQKCPPIHNLFQAQAPRVIPDTIEMDNLTTATEKILFAILWKNGDILKIPHLIAGLQGANNPSETAMTFYQLGKFLMFPIDNPIVDQHVIRAYRALECDILDDEALSKIAKSRLLNMNKDGGIVNEYTKWVTNRANKSLDLFYEIDNVMFAFGRMLKDYRK